MLDFIQKKKIKLKIKISVYVPGGRLVWTSVGLISFSRPILFTDSISSHVWMTIAGAFEPSSLDNTSWDSSKKKFLYYLHIYIN